MLQTDLGACEWFVWDLRRSNLIDRGQLDQVVGEFLNKNPGAEPPALADYLVSQGILTAFQTERLLQGKTQNFVLGPFTLMDALGVGSMGTVYKASSKTDGKWYAVKVLPRRSMWNVRIARRKVRAFEQCQHPSVVPFVDVGTSGGMHYLAWPFVEGESLEKVVQAKGKLSPEQAALYGMQTAEGLYQCHQQELFHGLLKPSNLMVSPDGHIKILDFGIGCLLAETEGESLVDTMSTANSVNSGLDCASPESIMDPTNLTPIGDQYSLGCSLYFCLTGRYPFPDGTAVEKMMCHQHKQPDSLKDLAPETPDGLVEVVERLMKKRPEDRYANCGEVMEALRPFAAGAGANQARPGQRMGRIPLPPRQPATAPGNPTPLPPVSPSAQGTQKANPASASAPAPTAPPRAPATRTIGSAQDALRQLRPQSARPTPPETAPANSAPAAQPTAPTQAPTDTGRKGLNIGPVGIALLMLVTGALAFLAANFIKF